MIGKTSVVNLTPENDFICETQDFLSLGYSILMLSRSNI